MKKILLSAVCLVVVATVGFGGYSYYENQNQMDPWLKANIEALADIENLGQGESWWDSKVYNCAQVEIWEYDCYFFKNIPIGQGEVYMGPALDPYDLCCGYFKRVGTDCVAGNKVAHCWDC